MVHGYIDGMEWARAVEKAHSFDPSAVRQAATQLAWDDSVMGKIKFASDQSLYQTAYVGQLQPDGQFKILWQSKAPLFPQPYDPLDTLLATWGVSLILQQGARSLFGAIGVEVPPPGWLSGSISVQHGFLGGVDLPFVRIFIILLAALVLGLVG